jgi:hypothetical protein
LAYDPERALELLRIGSGVPTPLSVKAKKTPFATSSKAKAACWSFRRPDGARASSTSSRPSCCAKRQRPSAVDLAAAGADAKSDRSGRAHGRSRRHDQLRQRRRLDGKSRPSWPGGSRHSVDLARAPGKRALPHAGSGGYRRTDFDAGHRRSALHFRLGPRLPSSLPTAGAHRQDAAANLRLLATTATANNRVMEDLAAVLGPKLEVSRGDLNRTSLSLQTIRLPSQAERLAWLAEQLATLQGHGIIYTLTVRDANQVAGWLKTRGFNVEAYTGRNGRSREALEQALLNNQVKALVATTALGMGYDKPDLAFVIHYQMPGSVVAYYQQVGRAGVRWTPPTACCSAAKKSPTSPTGSSEARSRPDRKSPMSLGHSKKKPRGLSVPELLSRVNLSKGRVDKTIALLSLEAPAPIAKQGSKWQLTAATLSEAFWDRAERLTALRRDEHQQMQDYVSLPFGEHMGFLIGALDGDPSVVTPALPPLPTTVDRRWFGRPSNFFAEPACPSSHARNGPMGGCLSTASRASSPPPIRPSRQGPMRLGRCRLGWPGSTGQIPRRPLFRRPGCCVREDDSASGIRNPNRPG